MKQLAMWFSHIQVDCSRKRVDKNFEEYSIYVKMFSAVEAGSIIQIRTLLS